LSNNVTVEPFAVIHDNVTIGDGTQIMSHAVLMPFCRIGKNCKIFPSSVIGGIPQDLKFIGEDILSFTHTSSFSKTLPLCNKTRVVLEGLLNNDYTDTLENIYVNAQTQMLLLYSLDCMLGEKEINTISCKFLANEADREKVVKAREILIQHIGEPITIKELSRKVAINECYLKKGFKELFGTTIFEFYQSQRMEHAKYLLYEKGLSVTEVSVLLGYSSISHFSTAFKKHTGLKPCELLFR
jgi:AraC-like DNA-binding protein